MYSQRVNSLLKVSPRSDLFSQQRARGGLHWRKQKAFLADSLSWRVFCDESHDFLKVTAVLRVAFAWKGRASSIEPLHEAIMCLSLSQLRQTENAALAYDRTHRQLLSGRRVFFFIDLTRQACARNEEYQENLQERSRERGETETKHRKVVQRRDTICLNST